MSNEKGVQSSFLFEQCRSIWVPRNEVPAAALLIGLALSQWPPWVAGATVIATLYALFVAENIALNFDEDVRQDRMYNMGFYCVLVGGMAAFGALLGKCCFG